MEVQDLPLDRISNLPPNIIQTILTLMPMRDAFRTSVLSPKWRDHCLNIPKLRFDYDLLRNTAYDTLSIKCKLLHVVYPILLRHQGPILEFSLYISGLISCCEIDQIILHLSRNSTLKKFTLSLESCREFHDYKLPPAFFKLQQLTDLTLQNCVFQPPVAFNGFSRLDSLSFNNVSISAEGFFRFISNCPLKKFTLIGYERHFMGYWNWDSNIAEFFMCLPSVEILCMNWYPIKCFATGYMLQKLPIPLVHLKHVHLSGLSFAREVDLRFALLLVTSSPNIEKIVVQMHNNPAEAMSQTAMNLVDQEDYSYVILDHLREIQIMNLTYMKTGMDFMKLILTKSPMLKKVDIFIDKQVDIYGEVQMLKELIQYQRASAAVEMTVK